jgi:hypothetical protein
VYQASKYSDCSSAKRGGDLGPFGRGEMQVKILKIYITGYDRQSAEDITQFCCISLTVAFNYFKSLLQNFGLVWTGSKFGNLGLGNGKS